MVGSGLHASAPGLSVCQALCLALGDRHHMLARERGSSKEWHV